MKIVVRAKPGAKKEYVKEMTDLFAPADRRRFIVAVHEPATEGRANRAIERVLAGHLGIAPSRVRIVAGFTAKEKIVEISSPDAVG